jgi:hypothetical protein
MFLKSKPPQITQQYPPNQGLLRKHQRNKRGVIDVPLKRKKKEEKKEKKPEEKK